MKAYDELRRLERVMAAHERWLRVCMWALVGCLAVQVVILIALGMR